MFTIGNETFATAELAYFAMLDKSPRTRATEVATGLSLSVADVEAIWMAEPRPLLSVAEVEAWFGRCRTARAVEGAARDLSTLSPDPRPEHAAALALVGDGHVLAPLAGGAVVALIGGTEDRMPELCDIRLFDAAHPAGRTILHPAAQAAIA